MDLSLLDGCDATDVSIARCFATIYLNTFRYAGNKQWDYYDNDTKTWKRDEGRKQLLSCICTEFSGAFLARAQWWQQACNDQDPNKAHERAFLVQRLLSISSKLRRTAKHSPLLRDLAAWLNVDS